MKVIFSQEGIKNEILNVLFFNHTGNILSVKYFDGSNEKFPNVDHILKISDENGKMSVWYYTKNCNGNIGTSNTVSFVKYDIDSNALTINYADGKIETEKDLDYISNAYDSNFKSKDHEILL